MPNKISAIYVCSNCDAQFPKWSGRCLECGGWGTLQMRTIDKKATPDQTLAASPAELLDLNNIEPASEANQTRQRIKTGISEIDRVLGGGLMPGSLVLLSGEPGIGKSTIVAQIAQAVGQHKDSNQVIYMSGEESPFQIKDRFDRLKINSNNIKFLNHTDIGVVAATIGRLRPALSIIDSIQTLRSDLVASEAGSLNQIRACAVNLLEAAKTNNVAIIIIGHITKDGFIAGPKSLEHIVDTVIYLENETTHNYKILRATKNRFGSINEIGIFEMTAGGFREILNPSTIFIEKKENNISGSVISCIMEGTRPFLLEIQALVTKTVFGYPQRRAAGFDLNRLQILIAVLTKRTNINLTNQDVLINVVGGVKIEDPAIDLAVSLAIITSLLNQTMDKKNIILGEVGLGGEIRQANKLDQRLKEAEKLGFDRAIIPDQAVSTSSIKLIKIKNLKEVVELIAHL